MAIQIANPQVVSKIEHMAALLGTTKTAAVERALDAYSSHLLQAETVAEQQRAYEEKYASLMAIAKKIQAMPDIAPNSPTDLEWDEYGLPV